MITDKLTTFALGTALNTGGAGTYLVGDVIDLEDLRDIGQGENLYLVLSMAAAATSGGSATAAFALASDAQAAIATNGTATIHYQTPAIPVATLVAGYDIATFVLPMEGVLYERYLGILQTTATAAFTGGTLNAFLTPTPQKWKAYPEAAS